MSIEYLRKQLGDNEGILYTERHHWIFPVSEMLTWILVAVIILVALTFAAFWWRPDLGWIRWGYLALIIPAVLVTVGFLSWLMNVYVVTNRRVVEVTGIVNKKVMDSSLEKLTDVVLTQRLFGRILGYGDIEVLTARQHRRGQLPQADQTTLGVQDGHGQRQGRARAGIGGQQLRGATQDSPPPALATTITAAAPPR